MVSRLEFGKPLPVLPDKHHPENGLHGWSLWVEGGHPLSFSADISDSSCALIPDNTRVLLETLQTSYPSHFSRSVKTVIRKFDLMCTDPKYIIKNGGDNRLKLIGEFGFSDVGLGDPVWIPACWFVGQSKKTDKPKKPRQLKMRLAV